MWVRAVRTFRPFVLLCLVAVLGAACSSSTTGPTTPAARVEITQAGLLPFFATVWPTVIAKREGFFEQHGLDVSFVWGFEGPQIFAGGKADIFLDSSETGLTFQNRGLDVVAFDPLSTHVSNWLIGGSDVKTAQDLKGKTIGVSDIPSTDQFLVNKYLESSGLSANDVDYVKIDASQMFPALDSGRIGASFVDEVLADNASRTGKYTVLAKGPDLVGPYPWTVAQTSRSWIDEHPDAARGYIEANYQAVQFILDPANKDQVVTDVLEESQGGADRASLEAAYDLVLQTPDYFSTTPLTAAVVEKAVEALKFEGLVGANDKIDIGRYLHMTEFQRVVGA